LSGLSNGASNGTSSLSFTVEAVEQAL